MNLFNHKLGTVETDLLEGQKTISCTRTRKMAKSTSRGSSTVILKLGNEGSSATRRLKTKSTNFFETRRPMISPSWPIFTRNRSKNCFR